MSSYNFLSTLYDALTENVDYEVRSDYISDFFLTENVEPKRIIDLACGTCSISIPFAKKGIEVIGVDASEDMLSIASQKANELDLNLSLINTKMQDFVFTQGADAVLCSLDSINHLTSYAEVVKTFKNVYDSLNNGGIFVFDVNTIYKHQEILFNNTFVFDEEDYYLVWDNEQVDDVEVRILLDFFMFNGENYDRYSEEFNERAYELDDIAQSLSNIGFTNIAMYDELTRNAPNDESERVYFVCKKV